MGTIERIDPLEHEVVVRFDDRLVKYDFGELDETSLAYAVTAHKSQGSEWDRVLVVNEAFGRDRARWLYTAVTRAVDEVAVVRKVLS